MKFCVILLRAKNGNCPASAKFWGFSVYLNQQYNIIHASNHIQMYVKVTVCGDDKDLLENPKKWTSQLTLMISTNPNTI